MKELEEIYCINCGCCITPDNTWDKELIYNDPCGESYEIPVCACCATDPLRLDADHITEAFISAGFNEVHAADAYRCLVSAACYYN